MNEVVALLWGMVGGLLVVLILGLIVIVTGRKDAGMNARQQAQVRAMVQEEVLRVTQGPNNRR